MAVVIAMTERARATVSKHAPDNPFVEPEGPDSSVSRTKTVMSVILYGGPLGGTMGKASEVNSTALNRLSLLRLTEEQRKRAAQDATHGSRLPSSPSELFR